MRPNKMLVLVFVTLASCGLPIQDPVTCQIGWTGLEMKCQSRLEISSRYLVLWITTETGHLVVATARGRFPGDPERPIEAVHLAIVTPAGDDYWCSEASPMRCRFFVKLNEDGDRATILVDAYVSRDQDWRYLRMTVDAEVIWIEEQSE